MRLAVLAVVLMAAGQADNPAAPAPIPDPPASVERIREALLRDGEHPALKIPPPVDFTPVFRATVVDKVLDTPLQAMRRELAEDSGYSGRGGVEIIGLVMGMVRSIKAAHRAHEEAAIRKEVQEALNAFCAEHDCTVLADGPPPLEGIVLPTGRPTQ
jgi:hypothetical protein